MSTSEQDPLSTSEKDPLSTSTNLFYSILSLNTFWNNVKKQQTVQIVLTLLKRHVGTVDDTNLYVFTLATKGPRGPWVAHLRKRSKVTVEPLIETPGA